MRMQSNMSAKRIIALALVFCVVFAVALPALAAVSEKVEATTSLNVRSGPGTNYPIVGELKKGQSVTRVGTSGSWSIIEMGGKRMYAHSAYLKLVSSGGGNSANTADTLYTSGRANVRNGPGTAYKVLSTLNKDSVVKRIGTVGTWSLIEWNDGVAYISTSLLIKKNDSGSSPSTGLMEATTNVNVRSGPSSSYTAIGALKKGERVNRTGVVGAWTQVVYKGKTAYVHSSYLKLVSGGSPAPAPDTKEGLMEAVISMNVRRGPGTSYSVIGVLNKGDVVQRTAVLGNWTEIVFNKQRAYVFSSYLKEYRGGATPTIPIDEKRYITEDTLMYAGASYSSNALLYIGAGNEVILLDTISGWAKIEYGTKTGYVRSEFLSKDKVVAKGGRIYALREINVYEDTNTKKLVGHIAQGESLERIGELANGWTKVAIRNTTGYVQNKDIVALTSNSQTRFTEDTEYMYGAYDNATVYLVPDNSRIYRTGYVKLDERVLRVAYNSVWSVLYQDDALYYIQTDMLKYKTGDPSAYTHNDVMYTQNRNGAKMYEDSALTRELIITTSSGKEISSLPNGTKVYFREKISSSAFKVYWPDHDKTFYLKYADVK